MRLLYIAFELFLTMKLDGKVALVTGAARGIGWEIVQSLAQAGARVSLCDLAQADVDAAAARLALAAGTSFGGSS